MALPLLARTAVGLDLSYLDQDLLRVVPIKTPPPLLRFLLTFLLSWLGCSSAVLGLRFKLWSSVLADMLPGVASTFDFHGAGVSRIRPVGVPPSLELLDQIQGRLTCICGTTDPLIPEHDHCAIELPLKNQAM